MQLLLIHSTHDVQNGHAFCHSLQVSNRYKSGCPRTQYYIPFLTYTTIQLQHMLLQPMITYCTHNRLPISLHLSLLLYPPVQLTELNRISLHMHVQVSVCVGMEPGEIATYVWKIPIGADKRCMFMYAQYQNQFLKRVYARWRGWIISAITAVHESNGKDSNSSSLGAN